MVEGREWGVGRWGVRERWVLRMSIVMGLMAGQGVREILVEGGDQAVNRRKMVAARIALRRRALTTRNMGGGGGSEAGAGVRRGEGGMVVDGGERDAVL